MGFRSRLVVLSSAALVAVGVLPNFLSQAPAFALSNQAADNAAKAIIARVLSDLAQSIQLTGASIFSQMYVTMPSLSEGDKALLAFKNLTLKGVGANYTITVRSSSGTTFVVHGKVQKLTLSCAPSGVDCPNGTWNGPRVLTVSKPTVVTTADKTKVRQILMASELHYSQVLALGQKALGTTPYPNATAGLAALNNPESSAALFRDFRSKWNPGSDVSYIAAFTRADSYYTATNEPPSITAWRDDMSNVSYDLGNWVDVAAQWQIRLKSTSQLNSAVNSFKVDETKANAALNRVIAGK